MDRRTKTGSKARMQEAKQENIQIFGRGGAAVGRLH